MIEIIAGPATSVDSVRLIDEDHFVTCGEDGHVSVWGTMKKKPLLTVREAHGVDEGGNGQANWVSAVAAMPMSDLIATGDMTFHTAVLCYDSPNYFMK